MIGLEIIALLITPLIGVILLRKKNEKINKYDSKQTLFLSIVYIVLVNFLTNILIYFSRNYYTYVFTVSFFLKYLTVNIGISLLFSTIFLIFKKFVKIDIKKKTQDQKQKIKFCIDKSVLKNMLIFILAYINVFLISMLKVFEKYKFTREYFISKKYNNFLLKNKVSDYFLLKEILINTVIPIVVFIIIYILIEKIIRLIYKKREVTIKIKKSNINLNNIIDNYDFKKIITIILGTSAVVILFVNLNSYNFLLKKYSEDDLKQSYLESSKEVNLVEETNQNDYFLTNNKYVFVDPTEIVTIDIDAFEQKLPNSKSGGKINTLTTFIVDDRKLTTYGTIQVQGSSTALWPKKNWTIKLYKDEERTEEIKVKIGDSVFSDKWITKAEWIDPTMLRNVLSYNLWGDMVESRDREIKNEVDYSSISIDGAQGFPRTYSSQVNIDGEFYGLHILMLGHDPDNFNIDKNNAEHLYFDFDSRPSGLDLSTYPDWGKFIAKGVGIWIDGYYPKSKDFTVKQKIAIDKVSEVINGDLKNFKENFEKSFDKNNIIDFMLFQEVLYDWDALGYDTEVVTYDLEKWYFLPWDKDTTFGMFWDNRGLMGDSDKFLLFDYTKETVREKPFYKTYALYKADVEKRYKDLRDNGIFTTDNLKRITDEFYNTIPEETWHLEKYKWEIEGKNSLEKFNKEQIFEWFESRLKLLDKHFNYTK